MRFLSARSLSLGMMFGLLASTPALAQEAQGDPLGLSLDSLLNIQISSASKYDQTAREAPASVSVITSEDIERYGYRTLAEALVNVRGFYGSYDRNYFYLGVRGFSRPTDYNNRILLLIDGHPTNENFYDSAFLGSTAGLNMAMIDRIEVVHGPGSALYGSNAMLGVINVITKRGSAIDGVDVRGEVGSFGYKAGQAVFGRQFVNGLDIVVSGDWTDSDGQDLYYADFDDPLTNNGMAEGLDWDRSVGFHGTARYGDWMMSLHGSSREKGIPTAPWETNFNDTAARTRDEQAFVELRFDRDLGPDKHVAARGFYNWYSYDGSYPYDPADGGLWEDATDGRWFGMEGRFRWDPVPANRIEVGSEIRHSYRADYRYWDSSGPLFDENYPFTVFSLYAQNELQVTPNLALTLGLRGDHYSDVGSAVSPRGAVVYHPTRSTTLKALYGEAFRAPNRYESNYQEEDWFKLDPNLKPETIRTVELVLEQRLAGGLFGTISAYDYRMNDLINETVDPVDSLGLFSNVASVDARGLELGLTARFSSGGGYASYGLQRAEGSEFDGDLSNSPRHLFRAGAFYTILPQITAATDVRYDHERVTVLDTTVESYFLANLTLTAHRLLGRYRMSVGIRNIFDAYYETPGGFEHYQGSIPQDGREFRVTVGAAF